MDITTDQRDRLIAGIKEGRPKEELIVEVGVPPSTYYYYKMKAQGRTQTRRTTRRLDQGKVEEIWADIRAGMRAVDVQQKHGISDSTYDRYRTRLERGMREERDGQQTSRPTAQNGAMPDSNKAALVATVTAQLNRDPKFLGNVLNLMLHGAAK